MTEKGSRSKVSVEGKWKIVGDDEFGFVDIDYEDFDEDVIQSSFGWLLQTEDGYIIGPITQTTKPFYEIFSPKVFIRRDSQTTDIYQLIILWFGKLLVCLFLEKDCQMLSIQKYFSM